MISIFQKVRQSRLRGLGGEALNKQKSPLGRLRGLAQAKPESGPVGPDRGGVGAASPHFFGVWDIHALSCPNQNCPKNDQTENNTKQRKKHEQTDPKNEHH